MKAAGFIIILSILLSLMGPVTLTTPPGQNITVIVTLDVCHGDIFSFSAKSHLTGIFTDICNITFFSSSEALESVTEEFTMPLLSFQLDRPPKA